MDQTRAARRRNGERMEIRRYTKAFIACAFAALVVVIVAACAVQWTGRFGIYPDVDSDGQLSGWQAFVLLDTPTPTYTPTVASTATPAATDTPVPIDTPAPVATTPPAPPTPLVIWELSFVRADGSVTPLGMGSTILRSEWDAGGCLRVTGYAPGVMQTVWFLNSQYTHVDSSPPFEVCAAQWPSARWKKAPADNGVYVRGESFGGGNLGGIGFRTGGM